MEVQHTGMKYSEDSVIVPFRLLPAARTTIACKNGVEKNILIKTWGGKGDIICAEPAVRFALNNFRNGEKVTLASDEPELFSHLKFHDVYDLKKEKPIYDDFLVFDTNLNHDGSTLTTQFICHSTMNCLDFPSVCAFKTQVPIEEKCVLIKPPKPTNPTLLDIAANAKQYVMFHCGKHWQSKTLSAPKFYDPAIRGVGSSGFIPILVGREVDEGQGTVDTITDGCIDLRNKTTIMETIWLAQQLGCVITNDSSVLHMAATGNAHIGFIATAKHPDYIAHWRKNLSGKSEWSWRMENLGLGGLWEIMDNCPNRMVATRIDTCDPALLEKWTPPPEKVIEFVKEKMNEYWK